MALSLFDSGNAFSSLPAVTATGGSSVLSSGSGSRVVGRDGTTGVSSPVTSESVTNTEQQQQQKRKVLPQRLLLGKLPRIRLELGICRVSLILFLI